MYIHIDILIELWWSSRSPCTQFQKVHAMSSVVSHLPLGHTLLHATVVISITRPNWKKQKQKKNKNEERAKATREKHWKHWKHFSGGTGHSQTRWRVCDGPTWELRLNCNQAGPLPSSLPFSFYGIICIYFAYTIQQCLVANAQNGKRHGHATWKLVKLQTERKNQKQSNCYHKI